ncbi:unnamed protein product [Malus baccata var. baccata]
MERFRVPRRVQVAESKPEIPKYDVAGGEEEDHSEALDNDDGDGSGGMRRPSDGNVTEDQEPFMGVKVRRKASFRREYRGDYIDVRSNPYLMKVLQKQGDKEVLFADKVLKFTASGKMKRRILMITDFAIYIVDPDADALKRRIALAAVEKMCLSELSDNFFAIIVPTEYDVLMASTRKTEIVTVLVEATKSASDYELDVCFANSFEYNAAAEIVKEVQFEEVEGGVRTKILKK